MEDQVRAVQAKGVLSSRPKEKSGRPFDGACPERPHRVPEGSRGAQGHPDLGRGVSVSQKPSMRMGAYSVSGA
jgi:hypothetical protein